MRALAITLLCAGLTCPSMSAAEEKDDEKEFLEALQDLGASAGHALQCVGDAKSKTAVVGSQADLIAVGLLKDSGSELAFRFMVYFGIGIAEQIDKGKCADLVADWNKFTATYPDLPQLK